jgi:hypothetical protein
METSEERLAQLEKKIDAIYISTEKSRKYLLTMLISSIVMVVLPLVLAGIILPMVLSSLSSVTSLYQI